MRGADRAAERASGYDDRRLEPGAWTSEGQRVESIYCISGRTRCPYACVWGLYAVSLRVCAVGLSLYCAFFGTVKACELCRCGWRRLATQMTQITVRVTETDTRTRHSAVCCGVSRQKAMAKRDTVRGTVHLATVESTDPPVVNSAGVTVSLACRWHPAFISPDRVKATPGGRWGLGGV